ncbi:uncharacterized protein LOC110762790 [Prunus avium]|uniref:Uncharacterized protein LOC110762790 n=3 Tax=Prunus TaxID=3754 RepID=A0A6P5T3I8_PRUAV|nr:uncharacterized protein LOC110762790 [Prunus avium]
MARDMEHNNINTDENNSNNRNMDEEGSYMGVPIHSQVMKIKQEFEKIKHPSLEQPAELRLRRVLLRHITHQRSRSPLGLAA